MAVMMSPPTFTSCPLMVTDFEPVGREYLGDMTYKTTIALDKSDARFFWNMTATITIDVE
jgi:hypothetical protein